MSTPNNASLVLIGRHGAGKTAVIESLLGKRLKVSTPAGDIGNTYKITTPGMALKVIETPGFFAAVDINTCKSKLVGTIRTSTPSTDAFGMVIQIGRFTTEKGKMIDLFQEIFGEGVFRFTIVIFTKLDELTYDDMTLDEFLQDSTPELQRFLTACGGRYIGFDNTGDWETRAKYGERLVSMLKDLQMQNSNMVYTVAMLDEATGCQQKKEEEEKRKQEDEYRREKEEMKKRMRQGMRREFDAELQRETVTTSQKYQAFGQDTKYKPTHGQGFQQIVLRRAKPTQVRTPPHGEQRPSDDGRTPKGRVADTVQSSQPKRRSLFELISFFESQKN
ncbi:GTPase IMAP family member 9-like [Haliotis rufescens]|uniref:GTPase IMAP family member 9-like n=1 Tax=Haliotis rufescens TaxID=6454 RepID=UPI00201F0DE2|nr:GTPase IMAP family member 9-like [Haliotis rufescens]